MEEPNLSEITKRLEQVEAKLGIYYCANAEKVLEEIISHLDERTLQQVLRETSDETIATASLGWNKETLNKLKPAFSKAHWRRFREDVRDLVNKGVFVSSLNKEKTALLNIIKQLEQMGEIVIFTGDPLNKTPDEWKQFWADFWKKVDGLETWKKDVFDSVDRT